MDKKNLSFDNFLFDVNPAYHGFVNLTNKYLLDNGCVRKIDLAKNGYLVSYSDKNKRVILNFVFRKSGLVVRIYGDAVNRYIDFIETLPDEMLKAISKAPVCKRMIDMTKCNPRCRMGYDFILDGIRYQKCQYNCFMFPVNDISVGFISDFIKNELTARMA